VVLVVRMCGWQPVRGGVFFRATTVGRVVRMGLQTRAGTRSIEGLASDSKRYTTSFCELLCQQRGPLRPFGNSGGRGSRSSGGGRDRWRSLWPFIYQVWCNSIVLETRYTGILGCCCSCSAILPSCQRARRARGLGSGGNGGGCAGRPIAAQLVLSLPLSLSLFLILLWEWERLYRYRLRLRLRLGHGHGHGQRYGCGCGCGCRCRFTTVGAHRYSSRGS